MDNFQKAYLKDLSIQNIKNYILRTLKRNSWEQYTYTLDFGKCDLVAFLVAHIDPSKIKIYQVQETYCQGAVDALHQNGDYGDMFGNHFINKIDNTYYDFGKGANQIDDIYLPGHQYEMMNVELSPYQLQHFSNFEEVDYNFWADTLRYKSFIKDPLNYL